uniref:Mitochondrial ribosomal protein L5 n=1 Tax=Strongyloides venezuelensis TaxID=75913 RepID=A0A0K0FKT8_STRVS
MSKCEALLNSKCQFYGIKRGTLITYASNNSKCNNNDNKYDISLISTKDIHNFNDNSPSAYTDNIIHNFIKKWSNSYAPPDVSFLNDVIPQKVIQINTKKISSERLKTLSNRYFERNPTITECIENRYLFDLNFYTMEKKTEDELKHEAVVDNLNFLNVSTTKNSVASFNSIYHELSKSKEMLKER